MTPAWQLRPRSAPEIVDASVQLVREHAGTLLVIGVLVVVPGMGFSLLNALVLGDAFGQMSTDALTTPWSAVSLALPAIVAVVCWFLVAFGALVASASAAYVDGAALQPAAALRRVGGRAGALIGAGVLTYLLVTVQLFAIVLVFGLGIALVGGALGAFGGLANAAAGSRLAGAMAGAVGVAVVVVVLVAMFAAGSWLVGRYAALPAVLVNERLGVADSMRRARTLVAGSTRRVTLLLMLVFVLYAVVSLGAFALFGLLLRNVAASAVAAGIVNVPLYAFLGALSTVLYYDLRIRHEGLDLELLADELGSTPPNVEAAAR